MKNEDPLKKRLIQYSVSVMRLAHAHAADKVLGPIFNQVIRSACSIGANLTEAHGANTKAGFKNYFHIALQSARETRYWLEVLAAYGLKERAELDALIKESGEYIRIIVASLRTMKNRP